jgi:hypothetical protein
VSGAAVELMHRLHETFRAYVTAEANACRAFLRYQLGAADEAEVRRLQDLARVAADEHIEAMNAVALREVEQ